MNLRQEETQDKKPEVKYESKGKSFDDMYANDVTIWSGLHNGDHIRATVKPNISEFRDQDGIKLAPEKLALAGKRETFEAIQYRDDTTGWTRFAVRGFGLVWHHEWLEDFKQL